MKELRKSKKAFTLAEVLITIGIIGIVSALTIPTLIHNYQKKQIETNLKRTYSILSQALKLSIVENDDPSGWNFPEKNTEEANLKFLNTYIFPYLKVIQNCGGGKGDCWVDNETLFDGRPTTSIGNWDYIIKFQVIDGTNVAFYDNNIYIDANGKNKPNSRGKDIFEFKINKDTSTIISNDYTTEATPTIKTMCYKNGYTCAQLLMDNNWQFPADYPW